jgi:hypothetical protein
MIDYDPASLPAIICGIVGTVTIYILLGAEFSAMFALGALFGTLRLEHSETDT